MPVIGDVVQIPKILHQTVKDKQAIPANWKRYQQTWLKLHPAPEWTYYLWDDEENDAFVRKEYPSYYQLYLDLPYAINRVDLVRYLYLHKYGGFYADMDTEALKPIDTLCNIPGKTIVLGQKALFGHNGVECAFMGSAPGDPFWLLVVHAIHQSLYAPPLSKRIVSVMPSVNVLMTTGPLLLDSVLKSCPTCIRERIQVFPPAYLFPDPTADRNDLPRVAYTVHYSDTTWVNGIEWVFGRMHRHTSGKVFLLTILVVAVFTALLLISWIFYSLSKLIPSFPTSPSPSSTASSSGLAVLGSF